MFVTLLCHFVVYCILDGDDWYLTYLHHYANTQKILYLHTESLCHNRVCYILHSCVSAYRVVSGSEFQSLTYSKCFLGSQILWEFVLSHAQPDPLSRVVRESPHEHLHPFSEVGQPLSLMFPLTSNQEWVTHFLYNSHPH